MKEKLLLIGYRAWGDWLYTCPVLPYLFERYIVYLETCTKVHSLIHNDPRFEHVSYYRYEGLTPKEREQFFKERWDKLEADIKPDRVINLNGSLEHECITENWQEEFNLPIRERQAMYGQKSFYRAVFDRCGVEIPKTMNLSGLYFSEQEEAITLDWANRTSHSFKILIPIAGSTSQKVIHDFKDWTNYLLDRYPESVVYLAGDDLCKQLVPNDHKRIRNLCGSEIAMKQSMHMTRHMNYVLGPETGLLVAAGMWGVPKTMLCTTSSVHQCTEFQKNDHSLQAPIYCSPCHRAIYYKEDCHGMMPSGDNWYPRCVKTFKIEDICKFIDPIYEQFQEGERVAPTSAQVPFLSILKGGGNKG